MSVFGDLETPTGDQRRHPVKQLTEFSLKVYSAVLDPPSNKVHLRAQAKTAFSDGTCGQGQAVTCFLNGIRLPEISTDVFGLAELDQHVDRHLCRFTGENELVARIPGVSMESRVCFPITEKKLTICGVEHRFTKSISFRKEVKHQSPITGSWQHGLIVRIHAAAHDNHFPLSGIGIQVVIQSGMQRRVIAQSALDERGITLVRLDEYFLTDSIPVKCPTTGIAMKDWIFWDSSVGEISCQKASQLFGSFPMEKNLWNTLIFAVAPGWPGAESLQKLTEKGSYLIIDKA